jgi:hypothetical protein
LQSLASQRYLNLSRPNRSAAASKCCAIIVSTLQQEGEEPDATSTVSGRRSR